MVYDKELLNFAYARTGINPSSLAYDLELSNFINLFFQEVNRLGVSINVYGGTPLNRGFFGERQRLSLDLDIAARGGKKFHTEMINVRDIINDIGYREVRSKSFEDGFVVNISKGENTIKVEMRKRDLAVGTKLVELHPLLEYYGLPSVGTRVPTYEFEYLLASKLHAFARRMIYRDLYDSFTGLQMLKNSRKLKKYLTLMDKKRGTDVAAEIIDRIRKGDHLHGRAEDTVYEQLVPLRYRENRKVMANFVLVKMKSI